MKRIISFLSQIKENNNREWFEAHKAEYKAANDIFNAFVEKLIFGISSFDPSVKGLTVKDCTYRIYRDVRFSPDKKPYKTHMGAYVCPHGKNSGYAGYYFHIEPKGNGFLGNHQLDTGLYRPQANILRSIREDIDLNGEKFEAAINMAKGFELTDDQPLKKVPAGYPADHKYAEYLKMRNPGLCKLVDDDFILSENLLENTIEAFRVTASFNNILNRAVEYALKG